MCSENNCCTKCTIATAALCFVSLRAGGSAVCGWRRYIRRRLVVRRRHGRRRLVRRHGRRRLVRRHG